jgi:lipopolysaccharide/colanic/teichoic acid biosynthesis glycosyltransferase
VVLAAGLMNILLLAGWRLLMKISRPSFVASERKSGRTIVVGEFAADGALLEKLKMRREGNFDFVGLVSLNANEVGNYYAGLPVLTSLERLEGWLDSALDHRIQQVIFSTPRISFGRILEVMSRPREQRLSFKLIPSSLDVIIGIPRWRNGIDQVTEVPLLEIENRLLRFWPAFGKRMLDIALAGFFLIVGAPFFLLLWLFNGKLQSRVVHRSEIKDSVPNKKRARLRLWQLSRYVFKKNKVLSRLAQWPWLFAILSGKLSWVGPAIPPDEFDRPNLPLINLKEGESGPADPDSLLLLAKENRELDSYHLHLPLGLIDLTCINRRGQLSQEEKNKLYLYYVMHYSPLLDVEILLRTVFRF